MKESFNYTDVLRIAERLCRQRRLPMHNLEEKVEALWDRKRNRCRTAQDMAEAAVERVATHERRLAHGTGATGWV